VRIVRAGRYGTLIEAGFLALLVRREEFLVSLEVYLGWGFAVYIGWKNGRPAIEFSHD
jgi:hypothetical protein